MKAVMLSIQPKYCELIASGKKTVEVRKTKPKIKTPFKCYIYCTDKKPSDNEWQYKPNLYLDKVENKVRWIDVEFTRTYNCEYLQQRVIGEFVCDSFYGIMNFLPYESDDNHHAVLPCVLEQTCLTEDEIDEYLGQKDGYGWHISDLVIYDKPKELSEFYVEGDCDCMNCKNCAWFDKGNGYNVEDDCNLAYKGASEHKSYKPIKRPFQSWGYVEELKGENE